MTQRHTALEKKPKPNNFFQICVLSLKEILYQEITLSSNTEQLKVTQETINGSIHLERKLKSNK